MPGQGDDEIIEIVLEMIGRGGSCPVAVHKVPVSAVRVKLIVDLPATVDAEDANLTAAFVMDELDRLLPQTRVAGILIASVQFTAEGASGLYAFLASNACHVRHLALHNLLTGDEDNKKRVVQVCQALKESPLQVLDVSRNTICGTSFWKGWNGTSSLEQIILDGVTLDTPSWTALADTFAWDRLEDLHVVLQKGPDSPVASEAADSILRNCTRLSSLRWIQRSSEGGAALPCQGLKEMALNMLKVNTRGGSLRHLVLGGSYFSGGGSINNTNTRGGGADDIISVQEWNDVCIALQDMPRLRTLKLRSLGISEVERLVSTLRHSRPPLEVLDLSYNQLSNVQKLMDFVNIPKINKEIRSIVLLHNLIDTKQARQLFATFGDFPVDVIMDNNKVDFGGIIRAYQEDLRTAERERDDCKSQINRNDNIQDLLQEQAEMVADMNVLREENKRLREDRDAMIRAFSIMGVSRQVDEERKIIDRVQRLEDMVTLGAVFKASGERAGGGGERRKAEKNSSRRKMLVELPFQLDRLRSVSSRSIESSGGANRSNRSHSNRSQSTAEMSEDLALESPIVNRSCLPSPTPSTAPATAGPILYRTGSQRNVRNNSGNLTIPRSISDRRLLTRQLSNEELLVNGHKSASCLSLDYVAEHGAH